MITTSIKHINNHPQQTAHLIHPSHPKPHWEDDDPLGGSSQLESG
jgi:hypothetical protein